MKHAFKPMASPLVAAILVFTLGTAVTILSWHTSINQSDSNNSLTLKAGTGDFAQRFSGRLSAYGDVLNEITQDTEKTGVTKASFTQAIDSLDIKRSYPSIDSFGYVPIVSNSDIASLKQKLLGEGRTSFDILPSGKRDTYTPLVYSKSFYNPKTENQLIGYDLSTISTYQTLLDSVHESRKIRASAPSSITDPNGQTQPGVALIAPVFALKSDGSNGDVTGYLFASVRLKTLAELLKPNDILHMTISIYNGSKVDKDSVIYGDYRDDTGVPTKVISYGGQTWTIQGTSTVPSRNSSDGLQHRMILILGILVSALLALFLLYVIRNKTLELDLRKTIDVQKAKENLLSLASHQLRTPATGVKQYIGMVLEGYAGNITPEQREMLEKANLSNERQLSIVNQILKISKLENNRISLILTLTNPVELTEDIVSEQAELLSNKIVRVIPPEKEILVALDVTYFRMVIENLINNAAKYSHEGATITITFATEDGNFVLRVNDTGIGIASENFPSLYEAFTRIDNEFSFTVSGTGIGLYIDKMIVDLHEGTIDVESEVGVGTTFTIMIPMLTENSTYGR